MPTFRDLIAANKRNSLLLVAGFVLFTTVVLAGLCLAILALTGRDPKHALVAITTGLRNKLNREELQGVMAHEVSHIRNYDIRLMLLMAVLIGTVVMLADFFWQLLRWGPSDSRGSKSDRDGG